MKLFNKNGLFVLVCILWLSVLCGMEVQQRSLFKNAQIVHFKTLPVDPRDLFRGDYVILNYDFSNVDIQDRTKKLKGSAVYVSLVPKDTKGRYDVVSIDRKIPSQGLFLKGRVVSEYGKYRIKYGIESFFVEEGKGLELEKLRNQKQLYAKVSINSKGGAKLISVSDNQ